jgi:NitT/TauT family transport system ATP-binding protein
VIFSPHPGSVRNKFAISVPRPRRRSDLELLDLKRRIEALFKYDIDHESDYSI